MSFPLSIILKSCRRIVAYVLESRKLYVLLFHTTSYIVPILLSSLPASAYIISFCSLVIALLINKLKKVARRDNSYIFIRLSSMFSILCSMRVNSSHASVRPNVFASTNELTIIRVRCWSSLWLMLFYV